MLGDDNRRTRTFPSENADKQQLLDRRIYLSIKTHVAGNAKDMRQGHAPIAALARNTVTTSRARHIPTLKSTTIRGEAVELRFLAGVTEGGSLELRPHRCGESGLSLR